MFRVSKNGCYKFQYRRNCS